jgi:hypothetical protein
MTLKPSHHWHFERFATHHFMLSDGYTLVDMSGLGLGPRCAPAPAPTLGDSCPTSNACWTKSTPGRPLNALKRSRPASPSDTTTPAVCCSLQTDGLLCGLASAATGFLNCAQCVAPDKPNACTGAGYASVSRDARHRGRGGSAPWRLPCPRAGHPVRVVPP